MRFVDAFALSLACHVLLAGALAAVLGGAVAPVTPAGLDLTSVDLSFAEEDDETAASQPVLASAPAEPVPEAPPQESEPPTPEIPPARPLEPEALRLPDPQPERPSVQTPERPKPPEATVPKLVEPSPAAAPAAAVAPRQARVDAPPRPRRSIRPDYPKNARLRGEQGNVVLEFRVDATGAVESVSVVMSSGFPELDAAALRAVRQARFRPAESDGRPVASTARLTLSFRLD